MSEMIFVKAGALDRSYIWLRNLDLDGVGRLLVRALTWLVVPTLWMAWQDQVALRSGRRQTHLA